MELKAGTFACDKAAFFEDIEVIMGPDIKIQKVEDVENGFYFDTRKHIHVIMRNRIGAH